MRRRAATEIMALWPALPLDVLRQRYPMVEAAAASALRARDEPAPATLRRKPAQGDLVSAEGRRPYARFFGVREDDLQFRRFDGALSPQVTRAGFVMADAVTVLPYDPVSDQVMLVEQFRYGPWLRGDPNPWSLEPVAGRIDPGETPEQAARREAAEEAGLALGAMVQIGRYYPTPGGVTEYLVSYVGLCSLSADCEGVGGVLAEAEDIRSHVIPFTRLMALVDSGEVENGPLLLSALWLAANRARLQAEGVEAHGAYGCVWFWRHKAAQAILQRVNTGIRWRMAGRMRGLTTLSQAGAPTAQSPATPARRPPCQGPAAWGFRQTRRRWVWR